MASNLKYGIIIVYFGGFMKKYTFTVNKPIYINKTGFSTIDITFMFHVPFDKKHIFDNRLLIQLLLNGSKKYPTEQEFKQAYLRKMIINYSIDTRRINNNLFYEFNLTIPDPAKVKSFSLEEAITFFLDAIYEPNVQDGKFDIMQFNREKEYIIRRIKNSSTNIYQYSYEEFINYFDDYGDLKEDLYHNTDLIEQASPADLYNYYKEVVLDNDPVIYIYGDPDKKVIDDLFKKYYNREEKEYTFVKEDDIFLKPHDEVNYIEENKKFNQSALYLGYKIKDMQDADKEMISLFLNLIDAPENDLLFNTLRIKNNLVYSASVSANSPWGVFFIDTCLRPENKDKAIEVIAEMFTNIKNPEYIKSSIQKLIKGYEYDLLTQLDSKYLDYNNYIREQLDQPKLQDRLEFCRNVNVEDVISFIDRIKLDTVYFLRGDNNEN